MRKLILLTLSMCLVVSCSTAPKVAMQPVKNVVRFTGEYVNLVQTDKKPTPRFQAKPVYPQKFRKTNQSGEAVIAFIVNKNGDTEQLQVAVATDIDFGNSALESVSKWKFRPGQKNGEIVNTAMNVPIVFAIE